MKQKRSGMNKISPVGLATTALVANQVSVLATYNREALQTLLRERQRAATGKHNLQL